MALKVTKTTVSGLEVKDAYLRVEKVYLNEKKNIAFQVKAYKSKELPPFDERHYGCAYDINGENPIKQAYLHLKTLPEFAGAVDC
jgi:hypothetical protein